MGAVKRGIGEVKAEAYLKIWIINLQETLNPKRGMTPEQIDECAYYLIQDFYNLNLADINYVFTEAKKGRFGELYESLNMAKIISWFDVYRESRLETAAQLSQRDAQKHKYNAKRNNDGKWIDSIK